MVQYFFRTSEFIIRQKHYLKRKSCDTKEKFIFFQLCNVYQVKGGKIVVNKWKKWLIPKAPCLNFTIG